jgi:hypothetical protein
VRVRDSRQREAPNVLLIVTDQQRWDSLGCYGNQVVQTPHLDDLAAQGTVFARAVLGDPVVRAGPGLPDDRHGPVAHRDPRHGFARPALREPREHAARRAGGLGLPHSGCRQDALHPQRSLQGFHNTVLDEEARVRNPGFVSDYAPWFERNKQGDYGRYDHGIDQNSWMARPYHLPEYLHATNWTAMESIRFLECRDPSRPFFLKVSSPVRTRPTIRPLRTLTGTSMPSFPRPRVATGHGRIRHARAPSRCAQPVRGVPHADRVLDDNTEHRMTFRLARA